MLERLANIKQRYDEINDLLMQSVTTDHLKIAELLKEQATMIEIVEAYDKYTQLLKNIDETKEMTNDPELGPMAKEELEQLVLQKEELERKLELLLLPKDANDGKNIIVEIRGAAGGDEANIFGGDLYRMYTKYAESKGWKVEVLNAVEGALGGYSQIEFMIKGKNVYANLKYESGAHRVQRVPVTESQGRIHTSTATVLVMPEAEDVDVELKEQDLKIDVYRSSGAGGQSVNTTDSAVRVTHLPTGITVSCQQERSQIKNRERALSILKTKIYDEMVRQQEEALGKERKMKIGTGNRSEKIRTYNYPQNRVTDHRINYTSMQLDRFMEGEIQDLIDALITENQKRQLEEATS
jgi:peptide chain release factor 1